MSVPMRVGVLLLSLDGMVVYLRLITLPPPPLTSSIRSWECDVIKEDIINHSISDRDGRSIVVKTTGSLNISIVS